MNDSFSLATFVEALITTGTDTPKPEDLEALFSSLSTSERPASLRAFLWILLRTLQKNPVLHATLVNDWMPRESDLAQLLEDIGKCGAKTVLALRETQSALERLWKLSDDAGIPQLMSSSDPWTIVSLSPMAALEAERQLNELVMAVVKNHKWKDPAMILDPDGDQGEFDLEAIITLGQSRMVEKSGGSEALNLTMARLLRHTDRVN